MAILAVPAEQRQEFLTRQCQGDEELLQRIEELLTLYEADKDFLEQPPLNIALDTQTVFTTDDTASETISEAIEFLDPSTTPGNLGRLLHYEIQDLIGRGGMGIVFRGYDPKLDRPVAIKALEPERAKKPEARKWFLREARAAAAVNHASLVSIYAVEETHTIPFLVMELIEGVSLEKKIQSEGELEAPEIIEISRQIALGLGGAHENGLIHRDVKPGNILLEESTGRALLTDFGLACPPDDGHGAPTKTVSCTPRYVSPEQAQGLPLSPASDLFSLGSVIYTMCIGWPPFRAATTEDVFRQVCEEKATPILELNPDIPEWLAGLTQRLMAKSPRDRIGSTREFCEQLAAGENQSPADASMADLVPTDKSEPERTGMRMGVGWLMISVTFLLAFLIVEAAGWTHFAQTFQRWIIGDGTLVLQSVDSEVQVRLDGKLLQFDAQGEFSSVLSPGEYRLVITKPGSPTQQDVIQIKAGKRRVVTVSITDVDSPSATPTLKSPPPPLVVYPVSPTELNLHVDTWRNSLNTKTGQPLPRECVNSLGMRFRFIPPGRFQMGTATEEMDRLIEHWPNGVWGESWFKKYGPPECPARTVTITKPFYMGTHEVRLGEFRQFVEETGYRTEAEIDGKGGVTFHTPKGVLKHVQSPELNWKNPGYVYEQNEFHPVVQISWKDARTFCEWLSRKDGLDYSLPTEAQWEYACRGGSQSRWWFGDDHRELQKHRTSSGPYGTKATGTKIPNPYGLYDVHGNVWEWCSDWFGPYDTSRDRWSDPYGLATGEKHVLRGGSFLDPGPSVGSAGRRSPSDGVRCSDHFGFRIAITGDLSKVSKSISPVDHVHRKAN